MTSKMAVLGRLAPSKVTILSAPRSSSLGRRRPLRHKQLVVPPQSPKYGYRHTSVVAWSCLQPEEAEEEDTAPRSIESAAKGASQQQDRLCIYIAAVSATVAEPATAEQINAFFNFNPVCPAADSLFRLGQQTAIAIAGSENIENYRPLINDVLIRVRTEICVLESFIRETATPFIQEKGLGWVLPLHETSETYLAGVVFMVGANFILLGSTKVVAILAIYADLLLGLPARLLGSALSAAADKSEETYNKKMEVLMGKQMEEIKRVMKTTAQASERETKTAEINRKYNAEMEKMKEELDEAVSSRQVSTVGKAFRVATAASVPLRIYGQSSLTIRQVLEVVDTFCSRYFVTFTVTYIIVKTAHYWFFPNLP